MAETTKKHHEPEPDNSAHVSHERSDLDIFQIAAYGVGLVVLCLVTVVLMWGMFALLTKRANSLDPANTSSMVKERQKLPPVPRLTGVAKGTAEPPISPRVELEELTNSETAILDNYGWVDSAKGTARVPVSVAIDMVLQKGLSAKPSAAGANGGYRTIPSDASSGRSLEKISR